jgi:DNA-directed RNA polymerase subunit omega
MARVTVEDCLSEIENRFALVLIAAKRCRQLKDGAEHMVRHLKNKEAVTALREVAASKVQCATDLKELVETTRF